MKVPLIKMETVKPILIGICTLVGLIVALIVGLALTGHLDADSTPLIVSVIAIAGSAVPGLLAFLSSERTRYDLNNGVVTRKVKQGIEQYHAENETGATPTEVQAIVDSQDPQSEYKGKHEAP